MLRVSEIHLVRSKKLRSGKFATRHLKTIYNPKTTIDEKGVITVDVDHRWAEGQLNGQTNLSQGSVALNETTPLVLKGYLKGRGFKLVGYNLEARITNTNRRARKL
jgi:hypothetical protein